MNKVCNIIQDNYQACENVHMCDKGKYVKDVNDVKNIRIRQKLKILLVVDKILLNRNWWQSKKMEYVKMWKNT